MTVYLEGNSFTANLHSHTSYGDDGRLTPGETGSQHAKLPWLDGNAISAHDIWLPEAFRRAAATSGGKPVLKMVEVSARLDRKKGEPLVVHMGLCVADEPEFVKEAAIKFTNLPYGSMTNREVTDFAQRRGGFTVYNHPCETAKGIPAEELEEEMDWARDTYKEELAQAVERANSHMDALFFPLFLHRFPNYGKIEKSAKKHNITLVSSMDLHGRTLVPYYTKFKVIKSFEGSAGMVENIRLNMMQGQGEWKVDGSVPPNEKTMLMVQEGQMTFASKGIRQEYGRAGVFLSVHDACLVWFGRHGIIPKGVYEEAMAVRGFPLEPQKKLVAATASVDTVASKS